MPHWDDELGDAMKAIEAGESLRKASRSHPIVVRVDGVSFSRFTSRLAKPFDETMSKAMVEATRTVVEDLKCRLGYTQSDEASFVFWDPDTDLPYDGRFQKLASRVASKFGAAFLLCALRDFPEAVKHRTPEFDGRAVAFPSMELAARNLLWREIDGRKNALNMTAHAHLPHGSLQGKSSAEKREMLRSIGVEFGSLPEAFRRGVFLRRVTEERHMTPEELDRIPVTHRPKGPILRSRVGEVAMPPLSLIENLEAVIFHGAVPELAPNEGFAAAVHP